MLEGLLDGRTRRGRFRHVEDLHREFVDDHHATGSIDRQDAAAHAVEQSLVEAGLAHGNDWIPVPGSAFAGRNRVLDLGAGTRHCQDPEPPESPGKI